MIRAVQTTSRLQIAAISGLALSCGLRLELVRRDPKGSPEIVYANIFLYILLHLIALESPFRHTAARLAAVRNRRSDAINFANYSTLLYFSLSYSTLLYFLPASSPHSQSLSMFWTRPPSKAGKPYGRLKPRGRKPG